MNTEIHRIKKKDITRDNHLIENAKEGKLMISLVGFRLKYIQNYQSCICTAMMISWLTASTTVKCSETLQYVHYLITPS